MRRLLIAFLFGLPLLASAQAIRCKDPATGRTVYTDQPCHGGEVIVPARSEAERAADAVAADQARARAAERRDQADHDQRVRQDAARQDAATRATATAAVPPSQTPQCRQAMADADFRARSTSSTEEQVRTARFNAALACGQAPPAEVVVVPQQPWGAAPYPNRRPYNNNAPGPGWEAGRPGWVQPPGAVVTPPPVAQRPNRPTKPNPDDNGPAVPYKPTPAPVPSSSGIRY